MRQVLPRIRKAEDSAVAGIADFAGPDPEPLIKRKIRWPGRGIHSPGERIVVEDQTGAANMRGRRDHHGRGPVVTLHQLVGIKRTLDSVARSAFRKQRGCWDTVGTSTLYHHPGLNKLVLDRASGEHQTRRNPRA